MESSPDKSSANYRIQKSQILTLAQKFSTITTQYNKSQVDHQDRCREKLIRQIEIGRNKHLVI